MFAPLVLLFLPIGLWAFLKTFKKNTHFVFVIALLMAVLICINLPNIGIEFEIFRTVIYLSIVTAFFSGYGVIVFLDGIKPKSIRISIIFLIIALNMSLLLQQKRYSNFNQYDFDAVNSLKEILNNKSIAIPQKENRYTLLFTYLNVDYTDKKLKELSEQVFKSQSLTEIEQLISATYPQKERALIFIVKPWKDKKITKMLSVEKKINFEKGRAVYILELK